MVFVFTTLWSSCDSFLLLNTGLKQWPNKQHQYHSTCFLVLTQGQNEILHNIIESSSEKLWRSINSRHQYWPSRGRVRPLVSCVTSPPHASHLFLPHPVIFIYTHNLNHICRWLTTVVFTYIHNNVLYSLFTVFCFNWNFSKFWEIHLRVCSMKTTICGRVAFHSQTLQRKQRLH